MSETRPQNSKPNRDSSSAQAAASAIHRTAETAQQNAQTAADALRRGGQTAAEFSARAGESSAEVLRRSTEAVAQAQRHIAEEAAERFRVVSHGVAEATRDAAEDIRTWMSLPTVADRGLRDLQHTFTELVDAVVQTNMRATEELFRLANPISLIELQNRFVTEHMSVVMKGSAALVRAVKQTVDQSLPALERRLDERQQARESNPAQYTREFQTAAE
jgi:hypothetical protein